MLIITFREHFFLDIKCQIRRGDINIPYPKKGVIGAHIAQAEMGDILGSNTAMVYPPYFPNWNSGISHIIRKEHTKLKGKLYTSLASTIMILLTKITVLAVVEPNKQSFNQLALGHMSSKPANVLWKVSAQARYCCALSQ